MAIIRDPKNPNKEKSYESISWQNEIAYILVVERHSKYLFTFICISIKICRNKIFQGRLARLAEWQFFIETSGATGNKLIAKIWEHYIKNCCLIGEPLLITPINSCHFCMYRLSFIGDYCRLFHWVVWNSLKASIKCSAPQINSLVFFFLSKCCCLLLLLWFDVDVGLGLHLFKFKLEQVECNALFIVRHQNENVWTETERSGTEYRVNFGESYWFLNAI